MGLTVWIKEEITYFAIAYSVSLIMVTITSHIFINISQMVHFSAVKFTRDNEKNMSFLLTPKSLKLWKKSEAIKPGPFKILIDQSGGCCHHMRFRCQITPPLELCSWMGLQQHTHTYKSAPQSKNTVCANIKHGR